MRSKHKKPVMRRNKKCDMLCILFDNGWVFIRYVAAWDKINSTLFKRNDTFKKISFILIVRFYFITVCNPLDYFIEISDGKLKYIWKVPFIYRFIVYHNISFRHSGWIPVLFLYYKTQVLRTRQNSGKITQIPGDLPEYFNRLFGLIP